MKLTQRITFMITIVTMGLVASAAWGAARSQSLPDESASMTINQYLERTLPADRYQAIEQVLGSYVEGAAPVTLASFYGAASLEDLRSAIVDEFGASDLIPPLTTPITKSSTESVSPGWHTALRMCTKRDLSGPVNVYHKKSRCIDPDDTLDWLIIQIALRRSVEADSAFVLELPRQAGSYALSQALSIPSGAHLRWVPDADGAFSYLMLVRNTDNGSMLVNMNPYSTYLSPTMVPSMVSDIWIDNPRIDGRNIAGENGISFARGARNIKITGGEIRNLEFDPVSQGGRAIQCEQGCENLTIEGLSIRHTSFGISSAVHHAIQHHLPDPNMMQSSMTVRDVTMDDVEGPFIFSNSKLDASADPDRQEVWVDGATITNSGALTRARIKAAYQSAFSYLPSSGERVWCHDRAALSQIYDLVDGYHGPESLGIFYFQAPRNITIRNVSVVNDVAYPKIGGLVRGESGSNITVSNVYFEGNARAVFDLTGGVTGATTNAAKLNNVTFENIDAVGSFDSPVRSATDVPIVRVVRKPSGPSTCAVVPSTGKFVDIRSRNVSVNGLNLGSDLATGDPHLEFSEP